MELIIDLPAEASRSPNKSIGRSFWVYQNHKDKCEKMLDAWEANNEKSVDMWEMPTTMTTITIEGYGCRPKDPDNLVAGCKAIIDQLRYFGYIAEDNPTMVQLVVRSIKVKKRVDEKLRLILTA